jgi:hypothetical protein
MDSMFLFATAVLLIGTVVFLEIWHTRERQKMLDRIQSGGLAEYKAQERKDKKPDAPKEPKEPVVIL